VDASRRCFDTIARSYRTRRYPTLSVGVDAGESAEIVGTPCHDNRRASRTLDVFRLTYYRPIYLRDFRLTHYPATISRIPRSSWSGRNAARPVILSGSPYRTPHDTGSFAATLAEFGSTGRVAIESEC
jgi:hypothetical protein